MDVELLHEIAGEAGYVVETPIEAIDWAEFIGQIETGEIDMWATAT